MANSPGHQFGQIIGNFLEEIMLKLLQDFCDCRGLYLDKKGSRATRTGKKLTWLDKYENSHDLDFVIEKNGTDTSVGRPVAFIEAAWRRYTKHSKNKIQEIQGAVLPIVERHEWDKPFMGAVLAGFFTEPSLAQIKSSGFHIALFSYQSIMTAFNNVGIDANHDESTSDADFLKLINSINTLPAHLREKFKNQLISLNALSISSFFEQLSYSLDRQIEELYIIPLYGNRYTFLSVDEAIAFLKQYQTENDEITFDSYKIIVSFSNSEKIEALFHEKIEVENFLIYIANR